MPDIAGSSQSVQTVMEEAGVRGRVSQNGFKPPSEEVSNLKQVHRFEGVLDTTVANFELIRTCRQMCVES